MTSSPSPIDPIATELESIAGTLRAYVEWAELTGAVDWPMEAPASFVAPSAPRKVPPAAPPPSIPRSPAAEHPVARQGPPARDARRQAPAPSGSLDAVRADIVPSCRRCTLCEGRRNVVFGGGLENARLLVVGGVPGHDDDVTGEAWVGVQGRLLTRMLRAIGVERGAAFLTHAVKCRPATRREPTNDEIDRCRPFLERQLQAIAPSAILALGPLGAAVLTGSDLPLSELRGRPLEVAGIPVVVSFDPAWLLTEPQMKRHAWEDLLRLRALLQKSTSP